MCNNVYINCFTEMVRKLRLRGHAIRLHELPPGTSRSISKSCPTCKNVYDNGVYRKCYYLCCEIEDCFYCVLHNDKFRCPIIKTRFLQERVKGADLMLDYNLNDHPNSDTETQSESSNLTGKTPVLCNQEQKRALLDLEAQLYSKFRRIKNEECIKLHECPDEGSEEKFELDSDMSRELATVETPALSSKGQLVPPVNYERNMNKDVNLIKPDEINKLSVYLKEISEEYLSKTNDNYNCNGKHKIESGESKSTNPNWTIQQHKAILLNWLPVIPLDKVENTSSNIQDVNVSEEEQGVSRLRNGKIFVLNQ